MNLDQFRRLQQVMNEVAVNLPERGQYAALSAAHHPYNFASLVPAAETR